MFEVQTLPDVIANMESDIDNILIRCELRGIQTKHSFDFDKISITPEEIEVHEGEIISAEQDTLIQNLYNRVMK